jgi:hypothetical protein
MVSCIEQTHHQRDKNASNPTSQLFVTESNLAFGREINLHASSETLEATELDQSRHNAFSHSNREINHTRFKHHCTEQSSSIKLKTTKDANLSHIVGIT